MKKYPSTRSLLALLSSQTATQVVVLQTQGNVKTNQQALHSGMTLQKDAEIVMEAGGSIQLLDGAHIIVLNEPGTHLLQNLLSNDAAPLRMGLASDFFDTVRAAVVKNMERLTPDHLGFATNPPPTLGGGKKGMGESFVSTPPPTSGGGKKGMGDKAHQALKHFPVKGKIVPDMLHFSWELGTSQTNAPDGVFRIHNQQAAVILEIQSQSPSVEVNLMDDQFPTGQAYFWQVISQSDSNNTLARYEFTLVTEEEEQAALEELAGVAEYQEADALLQLLWEAFALEQSGFAYHANKRFQQTFEMEPENGLAESMYLDFLSRQDM